MLKVYTNYFVFIFLFSSSLFSCKEKNERYNVKSPDGNINVTFQVHDGIPYYNLEFKNQIIIKDSKLGFEFDSMPAFKDHFRVESAKTETKDETWTQPWGEVKNIRNNYNSLSVILKEKSALKRTLIIDFKVFNDGIGFRYEIPEQPELKQFKIMDELTEFNFVQDFNAWWIPAYGTEMDYEYLFNNNKLSELKENVHTPLTMTFGDSLYLSIHEAALVDYAAMTLKPLGLGKLKCDLVPWSTGEKVRAKTPLKTPWRTIQIAGKAGDLITSYLILNLNEPNKLGDVSWIKPGKYDGIWWGMHIKNNTWEMGPKHGATTENVLKMIDFAAENNISAVLVEGWNQGWENDWSLGKFNFSKPYADYDIEKISKYANEKHIGIIAHNETGANVENYEQQMEDAYAFCRKYGIHRLKTGYVNKQPKEFHQSQFMVNHYNKVMEMTAKSQIMLDVHEPVKGTGLRRTYPNMMTREGARGTEYEAWSSGNPPSHTTILPFTRCLAGPLDYTPGIFNLLFDKKSNFRIQTTLAKQLALYVVIYSPLQMVPDLPENYKGNPAFKFIQDVPTDWEETKVLNASIGDFVTIARKDRNSDDWYLGSITDENTREFSLNLDFLDAGKNYTAEIYADGQDASMELKPLSIDIHNKQVNSKTIFKIKLAAGGGQAIRFHPAK